MEVVEEGEETDEEQEDDQVLVQRHDVPIPEETHSKKSFFKQHKVRFVVMWSVFEGVRNEGLFSISSFNSHQDYQFPNNFRCIPCSRSTKKS